MKKTITKYYVVLILILMFAAPGVTAYLFYQHPSWLVSSRVNKGTLLNPPVLLKALEGSAKWRLVFWSPRECGQPCLQQLDMLARVRLALGRRLYQVDQWLLLGDKAPPLTEAVKALLREQDFHVAQGVAADSLQLGTKDTIFIMNPDNYLILRYPLQINPDDIYKDLKLLLNTTENKSG